MGSHPIGLEAAANSNPPASLSTETVTVYTRHQESYPKNGEPYDRCICTPQLQAVPYGRSHGRRTAHPYKRSSVCARSQ